jgi:mannitol-1-phosphate/altronate dehydrogenase
VARSRNFGAMGSSIGISLPDSSRREVFSEELANAPGFLKQVSDTLNSFYEEGVRATLVKSIS